jgi:putative transposase
MKYDPDRHHRHSIRLKGYDYAAPGAYFVTICVQNRDCLFGNVLEEVLHLNAAGRMVQTCWQHLPCRFPTLELGSFIVMPNHIHAIMILAGAPVVSARKNTLTDIVGAFKSITTNAYIQGARDRRWPIFNRRLWQRNYWERVIRNETEFVHLCEYIQTNPARWVVDRLHPSTPDNILELE